MDESSSNEGSATTDGNALPNRDPPDVTRFKAAAAKRVHRARMGLRCLTVRVSDRIVRPKSWWRRSGRIRFECKRLGQGKSFAAGVSVR